MSWEETFADLTQAAEELCALDAETIAAAVAPLAVTVELLKLRTLLLMAEKLNGIEETLELYRNRVDS